MSWWEIIKDLVPPLREALDALRTSKRKKRHLFVLKAIAPAGEHIDYVSRYVMTLEQISERIMMAQIEDAIEPEVRARAFLTGQATQEEEKAYEKKRLQQMKMGLPDVRDPDRLQEIEKILQEMTEAGRLTFYPPDRYAIKT